MASSKFFYHNQRYHFPVSCVSKATVDRILFKAYNDRVFFESSVIGSSSGSTVIDFFLGLSGVISFFQSHLPSKSLDYQCSFSVIPLSFYQVVLIVWLMFKVGTENPGFYYWFVSCNNIATNLNTNTLHFFQHG